jgi:hypothetical protein
MVLALVAQPARAEVIAASANGFIVRVVSEVAASPADAWRTMISPAQWWSSEHTFSGDAANLTLDPVVGGCFCETMPRPADAPSSQRAGGVQHMRIVYIEPPRAMRLVGALGPLQSEALVGTMTMTIKPTDKGSRILWEYVVGGYMRYKVEEISPAVDRMLASQMTSLAAKLGPVAQSPAATAKLAPAVEVAPDGAGAAGLAGGKTVGPLSGVEDFRLPPAHKGKAAPEEPAPRAVTGNAAQAATPPAPKPASQTATKPATKPETKVAAPVPGRPTTKPAAKKAAPKPPNPDDEAHRDANAAFDAALGGSSAP